MDPRRLRLLLQLARLGSMRNVADELGITTSTVSQQIAALASDVGVALIEPVGRRIRLTAAGRRLAEHAVTILAAVDAARLDLDPAARPSGTVRVGGFATAVRRSLLPVAADLAVSHPEVVISISEYEPLEALHQLAGDELDLALAYDYNLAPITLRQELIATALWNVDWGLGVPSGGSSRATVADYAGHDWIVNSRNTADEQAVRTLGALAGFTPRIAHHIDSLDLVEDLILARSSVGLLPRPHPARTGVRILTLVDPRVTMRAFAVTRRGTAMWPPLHLVLDALQARTTATEPG